MTADLAIAFWVGTSFLAGMLIGSMIGDGRKGQ